MFIPRALVTEQITEHLQLYPAAGLVGARQVGKTTLVKRWLDADASNVRYLDLQQPSARAQLLDAESYLRQRQDELIIFDEVQTMLELFAILRASIDEYRKPGRFILLGSAAPDLLRSTSESLAGRIAYTELQTLRLHELPAETSIERHWLHGGYPFAYQLERGSQRAEYFANYLQTFIATDLRDLAGGSDPAGMRRLILMLAHLQGTTLNQSQLGRSLEVSYKTVKRYLDILESAFLIRLLPPYLPNLKKRLTKSPKLYLRDSGFVHGLLRILSIESLLSHPVVGGSWEGYVVEQLLAVTPPLTQAFHYRSATGHEVDLVIQLPSGEVHAIEIKRSNAPTMSKSSYTAFNDIKANKSIVVTPSSEDYPIGPNIEVKGLRSLIKFYQQSLE